LDSARNNVQLAWKRLMGVALRAGLLGRFDKRGTATGAGAVLEEGVARDLVARAWELIGELGFWMSEVRACRVWSAGVD
jgi:hypothetical protein